MGQSTKPPASAKNTDRRSFGAGSAAALERPERRLLDPPDRRQAEADELDGLARGAEAVDAVVLAVEPLLERSGLRRRRPGDSGTVSSKLWPT